MPEALLIFRKDVRHLWPQAALAVLSIALNAVYEAALPGNASGYTGQVLLQALIILIGAYLTACAVFQEKLTGDRQYWLTRPIAWQSVILAKLIFLAAFLNLPLLTGQIVALVANGLSPLAFAAALFRNQFLFTAEVSLLAGAVAAVTTGFVQFVWVGWLFLLAQAVSLLSINTAKAVDWPGLEWFRTDVIAVTLLAFCLAILLLQYARRKSTQARWLLAALAVALVLAKLLAPWHAAFALAARSSERPVEPSIARLAFQPHPGLGHAGGPGWGSDALMPKLYIPVQVTGIPAGSEVSSERIALHIATPDGKTWDSGWEVFGQIVGAAESSQWRISLSNGAYWLLTRVDRKLYEQWNSAAVNLRAVVAFTLREGPTTATLPTDGRAQSVAGAGLCAAFRNGPAFESVCLSPSDRGARLDLRFPEHPESRISFHIRLTDVSVNPGFNLWKQTEGPEYAAYFARGWFSEATLDAWRPVARFERTLDLPGIRLSALAEVPK